MKSFSIIGIFVLAGFLAAGSSRAAQDKVYRISPEDVLTITIYAAGEMQHQSDMTVSASGTVNAPFIGSMKVAGLTPSELEAKITGPLAADYFVDPKVNIRVKQFHSINYYISGAVKSPGLYEMPTKSTLLELIAKAGGVSTAAGSVVFVISSAGEEVLRGEDIQGLVDARKPVRIDLRRLLEKGEVSQNPLLEPGDVVYIPPEQALDLSVSKIYVEGEVAKPGVYDYRPGLTALGACIVAGGFVKFSAPNRARIIRKRGDDVEVIKINLDRVQAGKIPDVDLHPGDRIYIPESWL